MIQSASTFPFLIMLHYPCEQEGKPDCSVNMHGALFSLRIKLPPRLAFRELATGESAELWIVCRHLDRVAVRGNRHASNLCHWDDLLDVVLRSPSSDENNSRFLPTPLEAHNL